MPSKGNLEQCVCTGHIEHLTLSLILKYYELLIHCKLTKIHDLYFQQEHGHDLTGISHNSADVYTPTYFRSSKRNEITGRLRHWVSELRRSYVYIVHSSYVFKLSPWT